jgi:hypothetical protein
MFTLFVSLLLTVPASLRTRGALQGEIIALRHQLLNLQGSSRGHKPRLSSADRVFSHWWRGAAMRPCECSQSAWL